MAKSRQPDKRDKFERSTVSASDVSWALRRAIRAFRNVNVELARRLKVGSNDALAMDHLLEQPGLGPAELSRLLGITTASATVLLDRLFAAGHIERRRHPTDRRRVELHVTTSASQDMLDALMPLIKDIDKASADLDGRERAAVERYLDRVGEAWRRFGKERPQ